MRNPPYFDRMAQRAGFKELSSFDWIIGWAVTELGLPLIPFSEVHCKGLARNALPNNDNLKYAITHPVYFKNIDQGK